MSLSYRAERERDFNRWLNCDPIDRGNHAQVIGVVLESPKAAALEADAADIALDAAIAALSPEKPSFQASGESS